LWESTYSRSRAMRIFTAAGILCTEFLSIDFYDEFLGEVLGECSLANTMDIA
jgi:hypothetical protein